VEPSPAGAGGSQQQRDLPRVRPALDLIGGRILPSAGAGGFQAAGLEIYLKIFMLIEVPRISFAGVPFNE